MLRVGIVGIGFMGWIHYLAYQRTKSAQVAALCTRNEKRLAGDWRDIKGNFGPPGEQVDVSKFARYRSLDELLADDSIDLVDLCTPPAQHADAAIAALRAGKHVFCEKPMALTTAQCDAMVAAARAAGKTIHVGHVLPFFPEFAYALGLARSGQYGKVLGGVFRRWISDPLWLKDFFDAQKVGGPMLDLHVHDAHFIRLLFGQPQAVDSRGRMRGDVVECFHSLYQFADPQLVVAASGGVLPQQGRAFTHAYEIQFEKATLLYDFAVIDGKAELLMPCTVLTSEGPVLRPQLGSGDPVDAFVAEIDECASAAAQNRQSPVLSGDLARDAIILCHKQTESVRTGRRVPIA